MSWQTPRERLFSLHGPFLSKRSGHAGDLELVFGETYTHAQLAEAGISDRRLQQMYAAHWFDMAADGAETQPAAPIEPEAGEGSENSEDTPGGPENGPNGDPEAAEGESDAHPGATEAGAAGSEGEQSTAPADTVAVAYKCFGFGGYWQVNQAGEKLGGKMTKVQAEGASNSDTLPVLGINDALPEPATTE